jgi:hypothetical protein
MVSAVMARKSVSKKVEKDDSTPARLSRRTNEKLVILAQRRGISVAELLDQIAGPVIDAEYHAELVRMMNQDNLKR